MGHEAIGVVDAVGADVRKFKPGQLVIMPFAYSDGSCMFCRAHMSPSTFQQHFHDITGVSPQQYQKQWRLQGARQLMLNEDLDASNASGRVGYGSASQFSREYSRLFGAPQQRDIRRMRLNHITSS